MQSKTTAGRQQTFRQLRRLTILGAAAALLIQSLGLLHQDAAAGSDDARAVEQGRRSDPAADAAMLAALKSRIDEMHERRRGHRQQQKQKLQRLTPDERKREQQPLPLRRPPRQRDLGDALERVNTLRRRLGAPPIAVEQ
jgi:hypothetical protein